MLQLFMTIPLCMYVCIHPFVRLYNKTPDKQYRAVQLMMIESALIGAQLCAFVIWIFIERPFF